MTQALATQPQDTKKRYLHLGFHFSGMTPEGIEAIISNYSEDWIRYSSNNWIVWTTLDAYGWNAILRQHLNSNDQLLIIEMNSGQPIAGWLPDWIWDWLFKKRY